MRVKTRRHKTQKLLEKLPVAGSPCTPCRASKGEKSDESQFPIRDSVESKRPPAHAFIGSSVWHLPRTEANHAPLVFFLVDKKMLRGAKNFVDSLVTVFAHISHAFKRSKNFSDHIFYLLRLVDCKAHVKDENFTIAVRNDIRVFETVSGSYFVHSVKSFVQTFPSVRVG